ncbi:MAG: hypothetical protein WCJ13_02055 [Coriobacteriia bacterium]
MPRWPGRVIIVSSVPLALIAIGLIRVLVAERGGVVGTSVERAVFGIGSIPGGTVRTGEHRHRSLLAVEKATHEVGCDCCDPGRYPERGRGSHFMDLMIHGLVIRGGCLQSVACGTNIGLGVQAHLIAKAEAVLADVVTAWHRPVVTSVEQAHQVAKR